MRKFNHLTIFLLILMLSSNAKSEEIPTTTVNLQVMPLEQLLDGTIEATKKSTVSAEIAGRITQINFDVDNPVEKGDVLVRIRDNEYKARLRKAQAALNEAKAQQEDAKLEFVRAQDMFKKNVVSESQFDSADAALKGAKARVAASKAAVAEAKEQLNNTIVKAPFSGVVKERHVELGEVVNPGKALMTGLSLNELRAVVDVPQTFINAIRAHKQARIIVVENNKTIASDSMTIFPFADPKRHTFKIRVNLPKGIENLFPGMLVKVAFVIDTTQRLLIPKKALVQRSEVNAVYVLNDNGGIKLRQVRVGHANEEHVEILAGLDAGETISLDPVAAGIMLKRQAGETK